MAALRHIAAIRSRLLQSESLVPIVAFTPDNVPAIYASHVWDIKEPAFPCVTIYQAEANLGVWAPRVIDSGRIQIDCYSKLNSRQSNEMEEMVEAMLHTQNIYLNAQNPNAAFAECRKINWGMSMFESDTHAWRTTAMYLIRVFVS